MVSRRSRARSAEAQQLLDMLNTLGSTTFRQLLWQRASELDLTYAQSQVLFHVADNAGCHMGDVAKAFGVTLPAVTHIVDRLEEFYAGVARLTRKDQGFDIFGPSSLFETVTGVGRGSVRRSTTPPRSSCASRASAASADALESGTCIAPHSKTSNSFSMT